MPHKDGVLLKTSNLSKVFVTGMGFSKSRLVAVNKANVEIGGSGTEIFTVAGESGSGKSTLAKMILGLLEPTEGSITFRNRDVTKIKGRRDRLWFMKEVQPVFQNPFDAFSPLNKVDDYFFETAINFGLVKNKAESAAFLEENLQLVGLTLRDIENRYPHELSGGELQRLSVARALMTRPSLLVADEPVSMIDASLRMSVVNLFKELKEKADINVMYITHDLATAYYISDRIAIMLRGTIVELGPVEKVLGHPLHPYTQILRNSVPQPDPTNKLETVKLSGLESKEFARRGCKFAGRCPSVRDICQTAEPEVVFEDGREVRCHLYGEQKQKTTA
ncbi:MAG: ABC transporter ATP-binding protein [Firmicutes bacterium]|nr:ABC transporter ATP-binding protein [Bacillota bacterium]